MFTITIERHERHFNLDVHGGGAQMFEVSPTEHVLLGTDGDRLHVTALDQMVVAHHTDATGGMLEVISTNIDFTHAFDPVREWHTCLPTKVATRRTENSLAMTWLDGTTMVAERLRPDPECREWTRHLLTDSGVVSCSNYVVIADTSIEVTDHHVFCAFDLSASRIEGEWVWTDPEVEELLRGRI